MKNLLNLSIASIIFGSTFTILLSYMLPDITAKDCSLLAGSFLACSYALLYLWATFVNSIKPKKQTLEDL